MEEIKEGYTRVSQILSQWNQYAHIDPSVLANKCRVGTDVHEKIASEIEGIYIETPEDCKGYISSWIKWGESYKYDLKYLSTEKRFYCDELMITGAVDAIIEEGNRRVILDYKTSASVNKKIWGLQASFYHYLATKNGIELDPYVWFVHLKKDGKKAKTIEIHCTEELREKSHCALQTYRYFNG